MARQKNIHSEEHLKRLRRSHAEQATGFYKKGGKTRPITKKKPKKRQKIVKRKAKPASAKTPEGFGWQEYGEGMWTKGHQLVGITGDSEVVWLNEKEATDLVVLDFFDAYDEAVEWAKTWITENPDGLPEDAETEPEVIGTSGGVDIIGERRVLNKKPEAFGWKQDGLLWTKRQQHLEVAFSYETGSFEVLWGNEDTGALDVLESFEDQSEAVKYAKKWIVDREDS